VHNYREDLDRIERAAAIKFTIGCIALISAPLFAAWSPACSLTRLSPKGIGWVVQEGPAETLVPVDLTLDGRPGKNEFSKARARLRLQRSLAMADDWAGESLVERVEGRTLFAFGGAGASGKPYVSAAGHDLDFGHESLVNGNDSREGGNTVCGQAFGAVGEREGVCEANLGRASRFEGSLSAPRRRGSRPCPGLGELSRAFWR
jgi:hypothetical protein